MKITVIAYQSDYPILTNNTHEFLIIRKLGSMCYLFSNSEQYCQENMITVTLESLLQSLAQEEGKTFLLMPDKVKGIFVPLLEKLVPNNSQPLSWKSYDDVVLGGNNPADSIKNEMEKFAQVEDNNLFRVAFSESLYLDTTSKSDLNLYNLGCVGRKIFIGRELPSGIPLNKFIENHQHGIFIEKAEPIIKEIGYALAYAHQESIMRLDFKPANIFYDSETKIVEIHNFYLNQPVSAKINPYLSVETLSNSEPPESCDDIYALACVTYELLSGKHPFDNKIATDAKDNQLTPKPIKELKPKQFQALLRGLAFVREKRTPTVDDFLAELFPAKKKFPKILVGGVVLVSLTAITAIGYKPIKGMIDAWQERQLIAAILHGEKPGVRQFEKLDPDSQKTIFQENDVEEALVEFYLKSGEENVVATLERRFDETIQNNILKDESVKKMLLTHYLNAIDGKVTEHDFSQASRLLKAIQNQYGDSEQLFKKHDKIDYEKERRLRFLESQYKNCLDSACRTKTQAEIKRLELEDKTTEEVLALVEEEKTKTKNAEAELNKARTEVRNAEANAVDLKTKLEKAKNETKHAEDEIKIARTESRNAGVKAAKMEAELVKAKTDVRNAEAKVIKAKTDARNAEAKVQAVIDNWLLKCKAHLKANRLTTGLEGTALECYQNILKVSPNNPTAVAGLQKMEDRYKNWAEEALRKKRLDKVRNYLENLEKVNPKSPFLAELRQGLKDAQ